MYTLYVPFHFSFDCQILMWKEEWQDRSSSHVPHITWCVGLREMWVTWVCDLFKWVNNSVQSANKQTGRLDAPINKNQRKWTQQSQNECRTDSTSTQIMLNRDLGLSMYASDVPGHCHFCRAYGNLESWDRQQPYESLFSIHEHGI